MIRLLAGLVLAAIALVPVAFGAGAVRRRLLPDWSGLEAALVDVIIGLTLVVAVCEALGTVGWFRTAPVVIGLAVVGALLWALVPNRAPASDADEDADGVEGAEGPPSPSSAQLIVSGLVLAALIGSWVARTARALDRGMETVDTLWYHLPVAARFVETGHITPIHFVDANPVTAYYPATSSLLHGLGILLVGSDLASTVMNLGWLALALVAAWCVGRPFGVAPLTAVATAVLLGTPGLVATQPGGGYTDIVGLSLLLAAVAVLVQHRGRPRPGAQDFVVALAAGLALGTKFTFVGPVAALAVAQVVTAPSGRRLVRTGIVAAGLALTGAFWYLRNLFTVGNPLPSLDLSFGPLSLPAVQSATPTSSVSKFLTDGSAWNDYFVPGLRLALGPAWPAIVALMVLGVVLGCLGRRPAVVRIIAIVGGVSLIMFVLTPQYLTVFGRPFFFVYNLRYATPALLLGLVALPLARPRWRTWILAALTATFAVTQLDPTSWPTGFGWAVFQDRSVWGDAGWGLLVAVVFAVVWVLRVVRPTLERSWSGLRLAAATLGCAVVGLVLVHGHYERGRYRDSPPFPETYRWARDLDSSRIALAGLFMQEQYPFYGSDLSTTVQVAGIPTSDGGFRSIDTCADWASFLREGRYEYVAVAPATPTLDLPRESVWTERQPGTELLSTEVAHFDSDLIDGDVPVRVYRLDPSSPAAPC